MLDGNVDVLGSVGVFAVGALVEPVEDVEVLGAVQLQLVAVEQIGDQSNVAVVGEGIGHQLAVLPDAQDIGQVEDSDVLVGLALGGRGQVGDSVTIDGDVLASGLAAGSEVSVYLSLLPQLNKISCFATPRCAGKMAKLFFPSSSLRHLGDLLVQVAQGAAAGRRVRGHGDMLKVCATCVKKKEFSLLAIETRETVQVLDNCGKKRRFFMRLILSHNDELGDLVHSLYPGKPRHSHACGDNDPKTPHHQIHGQYLARSPSCLQRGWSLACPSTQLNGAVWSWCPPAPPRLSHAEGALPKSTDRLYTATCSFKSAIV